MTQRFLPHWAVLSAACLVACGEDAPPQRLGPDPVRACMRTGLPRLTVAGNQLHVRCGGQTVATRLKGINRSGLQHKVGLAAAGFGRDPAVELRRFRDEWGTNVVRLPFAQRHYTTHAEAPQYRQDIATVVEAARTLGLYVILELHGMDAHDLEAAQPDPISTPALWADLARTYGAQTHVLFDIWNEPHSVSWSTWKTAAEAIISAIRAAGASETLIVVGGLDYAYDLSPLLDPSNRIQGLGPIVYSTHPYPLKSTPPAMAPAWDERFGRVSAFVPVLIGEYGVSAESGVPAGLGSRAAAHAWLSALLAYLDAHQLSALAWSAGDQPQLTFGQHGGRVALPDNPPDPGLPTDPFGLDVRAWMQAPVM